jgi:hypothetical protein
MRLPGPISAFAHWKSKADDKRRTSALRRKEALIALGFGVALFVAVPRALNFNLFPC